MRQVREDLRFTSSPDKRRLPRIGKLHELQCAQRAFIEPIDDLPNGSLSALAQRLYQCISIDAITRT